MKGNKFMYRDFIDLEDGLNRVRGNKALFIRMLGMFKASAEVSQFPVDVESGDLEAATRTIHAVKGMAGNLSLKPLFDLSTELLGDLRGGTFDPSRVSEYKKCVEDTTAAIDELVSDPLV